MNIMISSMNAITTCSAYCVNTVIFPNSSTFCGMPTASLMRSAPIKYTTRVSPFMHTVIIGIKSPSPREVKRLVRMTDSFTFSNRSLWNDSALNARTTRTPVILSRVAVLRLSVSFWILRNLG